MAGIGAIGGAAGANPLNGLGGTGGLSGGAGGSLSGMADNGMGLAGQDSGAAGSGAFGMGPTQPASQSQGAAFGDTLRSMVIDRPSASKAAAGELTARFAAGDTSIDPHKIAIMSAKAGVEVQMATRTISSAVSAVRTLFQMQV